MVIREQTRNRDVERAPADDRVLRAVLVGSNFQADEVLDLSGLWRLLRERWLTLSCVLLVGAAAGWGLSYLLTKKYRAEAVLTLVESSAPEGAMHALGDQLSGLASFAGLDVSSTDRERGATIAMLHSHLFVEQFLAAQNVLPYLFPDRWDARAGRWKPGVVQPTLQDGAELFIKRILTVNEDHKTGIVTLRIQWSKRDLLSGWANTMVAMANAANRERAIRDATQSIDYLQKEAAGADTVELKQSIYSLLESQMNKRMLAVTRPEFSFRVIDPAQEPRLRDYVSPIRPLFAAGGGLLALIIGCIAGIALQKPRGA
jgi:hypothetical protein